MLKILTLCGVGCCRRTHMYGCMDVRIRGSGNGPGNPGMRVGWGRLGKGSWMGFVRGGGLMVRFSDGRQAWTWRSLGWQPPQAPEAVYFTFQSGIVLGNSNTHLYFSHHFYWNGDHTVTWHFGETGDQCPDSQVYIQLLYASHFSNWCNIYQVAEVVHRSWSDNSVISQIHSCHQYE